MENIKEISKTNWIEFWLQIMFIIAVLLGITTIVFIFLVLWAEDTILMIRWMVTFALSTGILYFIGSYIESNYY